MICVEVMPMATNLQIDDTLIAKAAKLGGHRTKKAAVTHALLEYVRHLQQQKVTSLFGTVDYDPAYDYKKQRTRS
jgi:Arc/MetJ family transcription regulator